MKTLCFQGWKSISVIYAHDGFSFSDPHMYAGERRYRLLSPHPTPTTFLSSTAFNIPSVIPVPGLSRECGHYICFLSFTGTPYVCHLLETLAPSSSLGPQGDAKCSAAQERDLSCPHTVVLASGRDTAFFFFKLGFLFMGNLPFSQVQSP